MIYTAKYYLKGVVHPKITTHPQIVSNLFHVIMCKLTGYIQVKILFKKSYLIVTPMTVIFKGQIKKSSALKE